MASKVIDFVGLDLIEKLYERDGIGQIAIVKMQPSGTAMRRLGEMVDARADDGAGASHDTVDFIALLQKEFGEIRTILSGDTGDEGDFRHRGWPRTRLFKIRV